MSLANPIRRVPRLGTASRMGQASCASCGRRFDSHLHQLLYSSDCSHARCPSCIAEQAKRRPGFSNAPLTPQMTRRTFDRRFYSSVRERRHSVNTNEQTNHAPAAGTVKPTSYWRYKLPEDEENFDPPPASQAQDDLFQQLHQILTRSDSPLMFDQQSVCSRPKTPVEESTPIMPMANSADSNNSESLVSLITASSGSALTSGLGHSGSPYTPFQRHKPLSSRGSSLSSMENGANPFSPPSRRSHRNVPMVIRPPGMSAAPASSRPIQLRVKPMQFEIPCVDETAPIIGRQWLCHELHEILVKPTGALAEETSSIRGAVIHGAVGTGKTAALYHLASKSKSHRTAARGLSTRTGASPSTGDHTVSTDSGFVGSSRLSLLPPSTSGLPVNSAEWANRVAEQVVAYHFCQVDVNESCKLPRFLESIAAMMAYSPQLRCYGEYLESQPHLQDLLKENQCLLDPVSAFRKAFVEPLNTLRKCNKIPVAQNFLILVDALDEAEFHRPEFGESVGSFVSKYFRELPSWIKIVFTIKTSALDLVRGFPCHKINLDNVVMDERIFNDIEQYIVYRIQQSSQIYANLTLGPTKSDPTTPAATFLSQFVDHVASLSGGNFLYLKLVLNLIERSHLVMKSASFKSLPINLSETFLLLFNLKFPSIKSFESVSAILNVCLTTLYPLTAQQIYEAVAAGTVTQCLTWEEFCDRLLSLYDFIIQREDEKFVLFHPAFRDWLVRREDGESPKFLCDTRYGHALLALRLSRTAGGVPQEQLAELGHHILKAHIYKQMGRDLPPGLSSKDAQALWVAYAARDIRPALAWDQNVLSPNTKVSRLLLLAGASPDAVTNYHHKAPLLCVAARQGCIEMVSLLLEFGADVCATSEDGASPLMHAAMMGHIDVVQLLHQHGARLGQIDGENNCALVLAAKAGYVSIASFLLQCDWSEMSESTGENMTSSTYGAALRNQAAQQAFVAAAGNGRTKICQFLLEFGDVKIDGTDPNAGETALSVACANACKETVQYLLANGAAVSYNPRRNTSTPPLIQAVTGGCWEMVSSLLARGADVNRERNGLKQTPLMLAAIHGHIGVMELLLSRDADALSVDTKGRSALAWACIKNQLPCVSLLLDRGALVAQADNDGKEPIHHGAEHGRRQLIQVLMDRGASLETPDSRGHRPLELAIEAGNDDALACCLRRGAKLGPVTWQMAQGKYPALLLLLKKLLEDGLLLYKRNRLKESSQRFAYALKKFPTENIPCDQQKVFMDLKHSLLMNHGRCKRKLGDPHAALDLVNQSLSLRPHSFEAYYVRARCYKDLSDMKRAYMDIAEAVRLAPSDPDSKHFLSYVQKEMAGSLASLVPSSRGSDKHRSFIESSLDANHFQSAISELSRSVQTRMSDLSRRDRDVRQSVASSNLDSEFDKSGPPSTTVDTVLLAPSSNPPRPSPIAGNSSSDSGNAGDLSDDGAVPKLKGGKSVVTCQSHVLNHSRESEC